MKPAAASADNGAFSVQKSIFGPECTSIRFRPKNRFLNTPFGPEKSTILSSLATQFHEISGLNAYRIKQAESCLIFNTKADFAGPH
jgi:hypothetical protein